MKRQSVLRSFGVSLVLLLPCLAAETNSILIRNVTIHPVTSGEIANGAVLVVNGKIAEVGTKVGARAGARVIDGRGLHLISGTDQRRHVTLGSLRFPLSETR